ncbi:MAG TPA: GNAT family N-acetyltransferase [Thermoanaerobaculia bacterium]|nr:GNAT family N-acetyltransferase [Thermoanaerobaculia bacterium]
MSLTIAPTTDMQSVRVLFLEYAHSLGVDLSFQNFDEELASLPGDYDPILLAHWDGELAGCVAMHPFGEPGICEMKRLYLRPQFRGKSIGKQLALRIIDEARNRRYRAMRLDTLPAMHDAKAMYEALGFRDIAPYRFNPIEGTRFMELIL